MHMFFFGANLKMHQTPPESRDYLARLTASLRDVPDRDQATVWVIPPFTSLASVSDLCATHGLILGAQNMHWDDEGARTGEISPRMLKACGVRWVMLGHAERRGQFGETDEMLNRKALAAARHGLTALLCVGEPAHIKEAGAGDDYVAQQLKLDLAGFPRDAGLVVLYEPLWSVGAGGTAADPGYVAAAMDNIRRVLGGLFGAMRVPVLYGGSVDADNCGQYARLPQADGMGIGRAGLRPESFVRVLERALRARYTKGRTVNTETRRLHRGHR